MKTPPYSLKDAQNDCEVIKSLVYIAWWDSGRRGKLDFPSLEDLRYWWRHECPETVRIEAEDRFRRLTDWCERADGRVPEFQMALFNSSEPKIPTLLDRGQPLDMTRKWLYASDRGFGGRHPLGIVLVTWRERRVPVPANTRDDPLFPRIGVKRQDEKAIALAVKHGQVGKFLTLPGFGPGEPEGPPDPTPAYPLLLWEMASRAVLHQRTRHAAWLAARIFVDVILDVAPRHWPVSATHGVRLPAQRFREFLGRVYTKGKSGYINWSPKKQLDTMLAAFDLLESREMRIPWADSEKKVGGLRRVLVPLDVPRSGHADDVVQFAVHLPPGIKEGPLVDRPILRLAGVRSMPAWRLWLNLSNHWRIPGRTRIPVGKTWCQAKDLSRYPVVSDAELLAWAYPAPDGEILSRSIQRQRLHRAQTALKWMADLKAVEIVSSSDGKRVIPGPEWARHGRQKGK